MLYLDTAEESLYLSVWQKADFFFVPYDRCREV